MNNNSNDQQKRIAKLEAINLGLIKTLTELEAEKAKLAEALEEALHHVIISPDHVRSDFIQEIEAALSAYQERKAAMTNDRSEDFDYGDYPIPDWAIGRCKGSYVLGAQLPTRDGRRCGNAHIIYSEPATWDKTVLIYTVLTDAGNTMKLTRNEVEGMFYSPVWVSAVEEVIRKFGSNASGIHGAES